MQSLKENITGILLKSGHITKGKLKRALDIRKEKNLPLRRVLVDEEIIPEDTLSTLFSEQLYMPTLCLDKFKFDAEVFNLLPEVTARRYNAVPLAKTGNTLTVCVSDPLNVFALDELDEFSDCDVVIVLSSEDEITRTIECQYRKDTRGGQDMSDEPVLTCSVDTNVKLELFDLVLAHALNRRASDIHIEPEPDCLRIRYRVDGALRDVLKVPKINQNSILTKLKIISGLDPSESRIPQDGEFRVRAGSQAAEFRVSSLPTTFGQKFVLHVLDESKLGIDLGELGFSEANTAALKAAVEKPFGMVLISGPADSGKSTTLYSILNQLNTPEKNIVTIEDPVGYRIEGVTQVQVKPDIGLDFACGLRSILQQSPDVVMIDHIRDAQTADIATKAALSGQLVFSTLQADDAVSSIIRLIEMGVEPFLVASSLIMLSTQRLARKICFKCREPIDIPKGLLGKIGFGGKAKFYSAQGCEYCNHTGFSGRVAVLETILIDDGIRDIIIRKKPIEEIREYAVKHLGAELLRDSAYLKVKEGLISLDEAVRIASEE